MSKYTPGPWLVVEKTDPVTVSDWSIQIGGRSISFFPYVYQFADEARTCGGYVSDPEMHANARLISAAPDSHEANKKFIEAADHVFEIEGADDADIEDALGAYLAPAYFAARDAIAKATGEAP